MAALQEIRDALQAFQGDPARVGSLASTLGFAPVPLPPDLLANSATALAQAFESPKVTDRFGVQELYRVADGPAAGSALYLAVLSSWGDRSSSRDRARRRVARAVVQNTGDTRSLILLVPNALERPTRGEIEVVMPRLRERGGKSDISTVRALVSTSDPSRFHVELLRDLAAAPGDSLAALTNRWRKAFSVERVTREFYQAYAGVRDRIVAALVEANPTHQWVIQTATADDGDARRREWATRQLGRVLFLWFLQSKRWLGYDGSGVGSPTYLVELWNRRSESGRTFWSGMLRPLFFEAMAQARPSAEVRSLLGDVPFLNGGLFRNSSLEDEVEEAGPPLELPDDVFDPAVADGQPHTVLSLLQRYRFTTRESTPDDQSVDPDPELLGRVFENLYQGDERHDTGTYYTPREIVHFMCRQALDGYLRDCTGVEQETLDWLRREVTDPEDSDRALAPDLRERIEAALDRVRICDPAVGSGAFLLGAMQEMVRLRKGMAHAAGEFDAEIEERVEEWKRRAIEHSLYGVDINPEAVEICQLRLWLSLVLDYQGHPREVRPLPNLDFRIRVGDSLIDRFEEVAFVESLPAGSYQAPFELVGKLDGEHEKIERWLAEYEHATPSRQREIRDLIQKAKLRVLKAQVTAQRDEAASKVSAGPALGSAAKAKQARAAKKAEQALAAYEEALATLDDIEAQRPRVEKPFLWPLAFPEVFEDGGFDLVLANPPYVRQEKLSAEDQNVYKQAYKEVYAGTADLLIFFYARAIQLLRDEGHLAFITSNKYMRAGYGGGLREYLPKRLHIERIIDFGDLPLFESNGKVVAAYPAVLTGQKGAPEKAATARVIDLTRIVRRGLADEGRTTNPEHVREAIEELDALLATAEIPSYPQALLRPQGWLLEEPVLVRLFDRLMSSGRPLGEYVDERIYYGIKTGLNDAFVIDAAKRDELIAADPRSAEVIKPWLRGRDIKRWKPEWAGLYLIAIQNSGDGDASNPWADAPSEQAARRIFKETYPAIHDHLSRYEEYPDPKRPGRIIGLRPRADQGRFWWELRACAYYRAFSTPKLVWPRNIPPAEMRFALDESDSFVNDKAYMIPDAVPGLVSIMNSKLMLWLAEKLTSKLQNGWIELKSEDVVGQLPILAPNGSLADALAEIARTGNETQLDDLVLGLYGVTGREAAAIREWYELQSAAYGGVGAISEEEPDD